MNTSCSHSSAGGTAGSILPGSRRLCQLCRKQTCHVKQMLGVMKVVWGWAGGWGGCVCWQQESTRDVKPVGLSAECSRSSERRSRSAGGGWCYDHTAAVDTLAACTCNHVQVTEGLFKVLRCCYGVLSKRPFKVAVLDSQVESSHVLPGGQWRQKKKRHRCSFSLNLRRPLP